MERPLRCAACRGWFEGANECPGCCSLAREVTTSWSYWLSAIMHQVHTLLQARFRERRGVVTLLGVPPEVGFALIKHFAWPNRAANRHPVYTPAHPNWKQATSKGGKKHMIKFTYDDMSEVEWAFPLHNYFPTTALGAVRLASQKRWQDPRVWGTAVQFKYVWTAQRKLGIPVPGVHTFTISSNITHVGMTPDAVPRFNMEYLRWVSELQYSHLLAVKHAVDAFPIRPLGKSHPLHGAVHSLADWVPQMPVVVPAAAGELADEGDDDDDDDDDDIDDDDDGDEEWGGGDGSGRRPCS